VVVVGTGDTDDGTLFFFLAFPSAVVSSSWLISVRRNFWRHCRSWMAIDLEPNSRPQTVHSINVGGFILIQQLRHLVSCQRQQRRRRVEKWRNPRLLKRDNFGVGFSWWSERHNFTANDQSILISRYSCRVKAVALPFSVSDIPRPLGTGDKKARET